MGELEESLSALEFAEWFEIWRAAPWENIPALSGVGPTEIDPLNFAKIA